MHEYLGPGVYVEEVSFRAKSIEGVPTSICGFCGPTRRGPLNEGPDLLTNVGDFERIYGGMAELTFAGAPGITNYLAHAVQAFFANGGRRLYVMRTFVPQGDRVTGSAVGVAEAAVLGADRARFVARYPGSGYNGQVRVRAQRKPATPAALHTAPEGTFIRVAEDGVADAHTAGGSALTGYVKREGRWVNAAGTLLEVAGRSSSAELITVNIEVIDADGMVFAYEDLGLAAAHPQYLGRVLAQQPESRDAAHQSLVYFDQADDVTPFELYQQLVSLNSVHPTRVFQLAGGHDGAPPVRSTHLPGAVDYNTCLQRLGEINHISIVAAPGASALPATTARDVETALIDHCERLRNRFAVLDTPHGQQINQVRQLRSQIDTSYAALYYPWVTVANPLWRSGQEVIPREIDLPPSGFVAGIYARTDETRGVWTAPANAVVRGALGFERTITQAQQALLNPAGVNCLRFFPGRGYRVWGACTASSEPEWRYVNVRRLLIFLEHAVDKGTQWAVFEPNGPALWANIKDTITRFLYTQWRGRALVGVSPDKAFYVRCDDSTMTPTDVASGRLICEIGVAPVHPAEFVIFRLEQQTADAG